MLLLAKLLPNSLLPKWETSGKDDFIVRVGWEITGKRPRFRHFVLAYVVLFMYLAMARGSAKLIGRRFSPKRG